ncbi:thiamine phosphate synthase [Paracoccus sp. (in: a-proteobacteria)]|uniref:thiamine phosphate synthase n=1 Tax=Paracoccus sp. TaxID=267 RepID=UPI003A8BE3D7
MIPPLCFVTDADAPRSILDQATAAASGGAEWVQLRHKTLPDRDFALLARTLQPLLAALGARLIVNDRVGIAAAIGAFGVHIGQDDGDPAEIRDRIGPDMVLGLSVSTEDQARAVPDCIDYLGVGPIRATASKPDHAAPIGHTGFARIVRLTPLPCLAIGGLGPRDADPVRAAGGAGLAVVSAISRAADPAGAARALLQAWRVA